MGWLADNWSTMLGNTAFLAIVGGMYKMVRNWQSLRATQPKVAAEADRIGIGSQTVVIANLNAEIRRLSKGYDNLVRYTRRTSQWHTRHLPFDLKAKDIIGQLAPSQADLLPLIEPFPVFTEEDEEDSRDSAAT